jgi:hypothetical protein
MKPEKRKRLEVAGWRVGTASEFLGLTDEEAALIELKLDLARAVKAERMCCKMTQEELGEMLGPVNHKLPRWREVIPP